MPKVEAEGASRWLFTQGFQPAHGRQAGPWDRELSARTRPQGRLERHYPGGGRLESSAPILIRGRQKGVRRTNSAGLDFRPLYRYFRLGTSPSSSG